MLRLNGYSTAQFGKCHEVPVFESSPIGPFDHWPHPGGGFEYFHGFIGGENNQWYPALYEQTSPVEPWGTPEEGYHLMADLADRTILWMRQQKSMAPDKPFFAYLAPGATARTTARRTTRSPAGSAGSSSTSTPPPRTSTT
jgi:arylsulfatase A-like enzyme